MLQLKHIRKIRGNDMENDLIEKLMILYLLDRMEVSLVEETLLAICCTDNEWMPYMNCVDALSKLKDSDFIHSSQPNGKVIYNITPAGRSCIATFYTKIPLSKREQIVDFVKKKRLEYRKKQELDFDYYLNKDGTYTVKLVIADPSSRTNMLEIKIAADSKGNARYACNTWEEKAAQIYEFLYEKLFD